MTHWVFWDLIFTDMKIEFDFDNKTIKVNDNVELGELIEKIKPMVDDWKSWKIVSIEKVFNTTYIPVPYKETTPDYPWQQPLITYGVQHHSYEVN